MLINRSYNPQKAEIGNHLEELNSFLVNTAKNVVILPNFLMYKFCGSPKLCGNCAFPENFYTRKPGEITVFFKNIFLRYFIP